MDKKTTIKGVGPDIPTTTNDRGGKQSATPYRVDLIPAEIILRVSEVLKEGGEKYGEWNWLDIPIEDHINHAQIHLLAHSAGDTTDDHLIHAVCRAIFAAHLYHNDLY